MSASLLLRDFYRAGVRVSIEPTGFLISPPDAAPAALEDALRLAWREVKTLLEQQPAPGRCQICGSVTNGPTTWPDAGYINCVECAVVVAKRMELMLQITTQLLGQHPRAVVEDVVDATGVGAAAVDVMHEANVGATLVPVLIPIPGGNQVGREDGTYRVPKRDLITAGPAGDPTGFPTQPRESQQAVGTARARPAVSGQPAHSAERRG